MNQASSDIVRAFNSSCELGEWCVGGKLHELLDLLACMEPESARAFVGR